MATALALQHTFCLLTYSYFRRPLWSSRGVIPFSLKDVVYVQALYSIWFELTVVVDSQCCEVENRNQLANNREKTVVTG